METTNNYTIPTGEEYRFINVSISYYLGGIRMGTFYPEPRGVYLHVRPVEIKDGAMSSSSRDDPGYKELLKVMNRNSKKEMYYAEKWVEKNNIELANAFMNSDYDLLAEFIELYGE